MYPGRIRRLRSTQPVFLYCDMVCEKDICCVPIDGICQPNNDVTKGYENGRDRPIEWGCCILLPHTCSSTP